MAICEKMLKFTEVMKAKMEPIDIENRLMIKLDQVF